MNVEEVNCAPLSNLNQVILIPNTGRMPAPAQEEHSNRACQREGWELVQG
jgi:hypothetical protein